jgi:hypothetical protein
MLTCSINSAREIAGVGVNKTTGEFNAYIASCDGGPAVRRQRHDCRYKLAEPNGLDRERSRASSRVRLRSRIGISTPD